MAVVGSGGRLWRALLTGLAGLGRTGSGRPRRDAGVVRVADIVLTLIVMLALTGADRTDVRTLPDLSGPYDCNNDIAPGPPNSADACICSVVSGPWKQISASYTRNSRHFTRHLTRLFAKRFTNFITIWTLKHIQITNTNKPPISRRSTKDELYNKMKAPK